MPLVASDTKVMDTHSALTRLWGERVASRRRFLGLSQSQVATHLGCDVSTISRIERGVLEPNLKMKLRIAGKLQEEPGYLFPWDSARVAS